MYSNLHQAMNQFILSDKDKQYLLETLIGLKMSVQEFVLEIKDLLTK